MFVLSLDITIGTYRFTSINDVKVRRSLHSYTDYAMIKIPATARLKSADQVSYSQDTPKLIQEKMPVVIKLGYGGVLAEEFTGYVSRVNLTSPVEIECDGHFQPLKFKVFDLSFDPISLKDLLAHITAGTDITLSKDIPDVQLGKVYLPNHSGTDVLDWIKKQAIAVYFQGKELYAGLQYIQRPGRVIHKLGWNVIKDNQLKYRSAEDVRVKLVATYIKPNNDRVTVTVGDARGMERTVFYTNVGGTTDQEITENLKTRANNDLVKLTYDGYEGKITTFLVPFCLPGYTSEIQDPKYSERAGDYVVESTEVNFGTSGARRICEIGVKVNRQI